MPEAMLIKLYTNQGGTMPAEYRQLLDELQIEFSDIQLKLTEAEVLEKGNLEVLRPLRLRFFDISEQITAIHRSQAPFFENTAEAKAREKHIEWLVLNMSYYRPHNADESLAPWTPFFPGQTIEEKLEAYDKMAQDKNELLLKAKDMLQLVAVFYSSSNGRGSPEEVAAFVEDATAQE
jgi:hypothetical protein